MSSCTIVKAEYIQYTLCDWDMLYPYSDKKLQGCTLDRLYQEWISKPILFTLAVQLLGVD